MSAVDSSKVTSNLWGERWSKLCANAMRNGLGAVTGVSAAKTDLEQKTRRLAINLAGEAVSVGLAQGFGLETVYGIPPERLAAASQGDAAALDKVEGELIGAGKTVSRGRRRHWPSLHGPDVQKGRRTEIDHINGLVVARGQAVSASRRRRTRR